jgi:hypothetical protein
MPRNFMNQRRLYNTFVYIDSVLFQDGIILQQALDQYLYSQLFVVVPLVIPAFVIAYRK